MSIKDGICGEFLPIIKKEKVVVEDTSKVIPYTVKQFTRGYEHDSHNAFKEFIVLDTNRDMALIYAKSLFTTYPVFGIFKKIHILQIAVASSEELSRNKTTIYCRKEHEPHKKRLIDIIEGTIEGTATKLSNPKDGAGIKKVPFSTVPANVMMEVGLALLEGACKYGRHNYREAGVRASVYYDASLRHLMGWWEGQDIDPDSQLSHITKAIAGLVVLRDAMMNEKWSDDRPIKVRHQNWIATLNNQAETMIEQHPKPVAPFLEVGKK